MPLAGANRANRLARAAAVGDLNSDGLRDVVFANSAEGVSFVYWNSPKGFFPHRRSQVLAPSAHDVAIVDLNQDSHPELVVANYTDDVRIFAGCLTGRRGWPVRPAAKVPGAVLDASLAHAELAVEDVAEDELRPRFRCRIVHQETHGPFLGFNRAQAAVVEAAILTSRLHLLPWNKIERELAYLEIAVTKTAGPRERQAWDWLMARIEEHRAKVSGEAGRL